MNAKGEAGDVEDWPNLDFAKSGEPVEKSPGAADTSVRATWDVTHLSRVATWRGQLDLHPEKTRLIEFGRYAAERRPKRGEGKPETFNFPGFTHICGKNHVTGNFMVYRKTIGKRMAAKLKDIRRELRRRLHESTENIAKWLTLVVRGYFQYHAVPRNEQRLKAFRHEVLRMWLWQLRRRSQRARWTWKMFTDKLGNLLPVVEVLHPYPEVRFAFNHPNFGKNIQGKNRVR